MKAAAAAEAASPRAAGRVAGAPAASWAAVLLLVAISLYMYLDRHVITLQVDAIRASLSLGDLQIGMLQGLGIALFAALAGYPIASLADRIDKRWILAGCVVLWAIGVVASGAAPSFAILFVASALVGAGEAGITPLTYALIPELFEQRSLPAANALLIVAGRVGAGMVIALTGLVLHVAQGAHAWLPAAWAHVPPWRLAFFAIALPAPLLVALAMLTPTRRRGATERVERPASGPERALVAPFLRAQAATFAPFYLGVAFLVFGMSALGAFLPAVSMRQMGATAPQAGALMGTATLVSTLVALGLVMTCAQALARRLGERWTIWLLTLAALAPAVLTPLFLAARTPVQLFTLLGCGFVFLSAGTMAFPTALQALTPAPIRTRVVSVGIILNIVLSAGAPVAVGALSDRLRGSPHGLLTAAVVVAGAALLTAAALLATSARTYSRTVAAAREIDAAHS